MEEKLYSDLCAFEYFVYKIDDEMNEILLYATNRKDIALKEFKKLKKDGRLRVVFLKKIYNK